MKYILLFLILIQSSNASYRNELQRHLYENTMSVIPDNGINLTMSL